MNASMDPPQVRGRERPGGVAERRRQAYFAAVAARAAAPASVYGVGAALPAQRSGAGAGSGLPTAFMRQSLGA